MSTYLSAIITVKNPEKLKEYISQVPATMAPFGAKLVCRGKVQSVLAGEAKHQIEAVFEFPSEDALHGWYNSDAYQALIPLRNEVCTMTLAVLAPF